MRWLFKLFALAAVIVIVSILTFLMTDLLPGNPAQVIAGPNASNPKIVKQITDQLELNKPLPVRYVHWFGRVLTGNFGESYSTPQEPVVNKLRRTVPNTVQLLVLAELAAALIAIPVAVFSAYRSSGTFDKFSTGTAFFFLAIPSFVLAIVLITIFSNGLNLLNPQFTTVAVGGWVTSLKTSIMPVACLAAGIIPVYIRLLRTDMITTLQEDFVLNARAKGLRPSYILFRHALRPSCFSLLTVAGIGLGTAIGGAVIIEQLFSVNGVGDLLVNSISMRDYTTIQAIVLIISITYVGANFIVDLLYSSLDPRIRRG